MHCRFAVCFLKDLKPSRFRIELLHGSVTIFKNYPAVFVSRSFHVSFKGLNSFISICCAGLSKYKPALKFQGEKNKKEIKK